MSFPYKATVLVNWLPVTCMPSPESPANRMTAWSITWRLFFDVGTSTSVDISYVTPVVQQLLNGEQRRLAPRNVGRPDYCNSGARAGPPGANSLRIAQEERRNG